jgi:hypothetical protein
METGRYRLWTEAINELGLKTAKSKEVFILIQESDLIKLKSIIQNLAVIISIFVTLILFLVLLILCANKKIKLSKKILRKEVDEAEDRLTKSFHSLSVDASKQFKKIDKIKSKRNLTKEEKEIRGKFKKNLKDAEELIRKEIEDIEKEI